MKQEILVPRVNTNDNEVDLVHWYVKNKQFVEKGQEIADIESSKAVVSIESEASGYVTIDTQVGDSVKVGEAIATIFTELEELEGASTGNSSETEETYAAYPPTFIVNNNNDSEAIASELEEELVTEPQAAFDFTRFSPSAKKYIEQHNLDEKQFAGMGLVSVATIERALGRSQPATPQRDRALIETPPADSVNLRSKKISKSKQLEISLLSAGQAGGINSSLCVQLNSADIRQTLAETDSLNGQILPLVLFEFSRLLEEYPVFNAYYAAGKVYYYDRINIGLAMDLGKGLKVPVMQNANLLAPAEMLEAINNYAMQYLENSLTPEVLTGGTITVSDLSNEGILHFQPLLNQNQSIILGIGGDRSLPGDPLTLTIVFDHRLSAGREVGSFLNELKKRLLSYSLSKLPQTQQMAKTKNVECSKCSISLESLYEQFGSDALMQVHINPQGETAYICQVCREGF